MSIRLIWVPGGLLRTFEGNINRKDLIHSNQMIYNDKRFSDLKYIINDFSGVSCMDETARQIEVYPGIYNIIPHTRHKLKVALVNPDCSILDVVASYCHFMKEGILENQIFTTIEEAYYNCAHCEARQAA